MAKSRFQPGDRIGRFTVIEKRGHNAHRCVLWLCRCDCGNERVLPTNAIGRSTKSCGCLRQDTLRAMRYRGTKNIPGDYWCRMRNNARSRGLAVDITIEQAQELLDKQDGKCALTGYPLTFSKWISETKTTENGTASLDRIDSSRGYETGNVMWTHKDVNLMKLNHNVGRFIELCRAVVAYHS